MVKAIKAMLIPNNVQKTKMFQYAGASRFAYNWALARMFMRPVFWRGMWGRFCFICLRMGCLLLGSTAGCFLRG